MDFRRRKLRLAICIVVLGMLYSLAFHGWQGWGLHHGFPHNTFLGPSAIRYTDFTNVVKFVSMNDPYANNGELPWFPSVLILFWPFQWLPKHAGVVGFLVVCVAALAALCAMTIRRLGFSWPLTALCTALLLFNYPVLFCFDRGNIEILLVILIGLSLYFYTCRRFALSFWLLMPPICFKLYPIVLLLLFVRRELLPWAVRAPFVFVLVNILALLPFPRYVAENLDLLHQEFITYNRIFNIGWGGLSADAGGWVSFKMLTFLAWSQTHGYTTSIPGYVAYGALSAYGLIGALGLVACTFYVLLVETEFLRRTSLLCLYYTISPAGGAGYKLMHAGMVVILLVLCRTRRRYDFVVVALLSLCLLPKKELFYHFMGISYGGAFECSLGTVLNPFCILTAMLLLVLDGVARPIPWRQRWSHLAAALWLTDLARLLKSLRAKSA